MLDAMISAFGQVFTLHHFAYMMIGVVVGLAVGVFPGLGGIAGLSLLIPFLYGLDPISGLAMMTGLVAIIPTSDTFSSILMGIPGGSSSQATVLDGFPLAKQGQAARALSAAFAASLFGGLFGAAVLTFFIVGARPIILTFRTPELLMLTIFGFSMVGVLAGRSLYKGIATAGLGMLVGAIGAAPAQGSERLSFGTSYLLDGFEIGLVGLGIFAIPEIVTLLRSERAIAEKISLGHGWWQGIKDTWNNIWLVLRCSLIGVVIGILPGLGGSASGWIAYGHTIHTTKDRSTFGKGEIRGVIGPEASNNANDGGGLVPTILFGIPGSGGMAVFLAGMILLGLHAGPSMIDIHLEKTYSIVWSLAIANVIGTGLCIALSSPIAKLTTIRFAILAPFLFMLITFAAFQTNQSLWDLTSLLGLGVVGLMLKRFDWPRPAFLVGFVLADTTEVYTYQAIQFTQTRDIWYLLTPTVGILAVLTVVSVWLGARQSQQLKKTEEQFLPHEKRPGRNIERGPQALFAAVVVAFSAYAMIDAARLSVLIDKAFPLIVGAMVLPMAVMVLYKTLTAPKTHPAIYDDEVLGEGADDPHRRNVWLTLAWFGGLLAATALVGFLIANTLFFLVFLRVRAGVSWLNALLMTAAANAMLLYFAWLLNCDFPNGILQKYVDLPWPLR